MALLCLSFLLVAGVSFGLWRVAFLGLTEIHEYLPAVIGGLLAIALLLLGIGIVSITAAIKGWPVPSFLSRHIWNMVNALFPMVVLLGKLFSKDKRKIEASFVSVSNQIAKLLNTGVYNFGEHNKGNQNNQQSHLRRRKIVEKRKQQDVKACHHMKSHMALAFNRVPYAPKGTFKA